MKSFLRSLSQSVKSLGSSKSSKVLTKPPDAQASSPRKLETSELAVGDDLITQSLDKRNSSTELIDTVNELSSQSQEINSDPQPSNGISMAINVAKSGMAFIKEASAAFPPLHGIAAGLLFVLEHHEKWVANKEDVKRLAKRLESLRSSLEATQGGGFQNAHTEKLMRELQNLAHVLEGLKARSRVESYVAADSDKEAFSSLVEDIRDSVMEYQTAIQTEILEKTMKIVASEDDRILRTLIHASDASHRSKQHGACLSGTRIAMLHTIDVWAEDPASLPVYWLNGHAGSGKSTIAQSFCQRAYANGQLGASFFCSRDSAERSDLHMVFPTLSFQLAYRYSAFKDHLVQTLKEHPDIARESLDHQLSKLLIEPLKNTNLSTILVIDALDECKDNEPESAILTLLSCHIHEVPLIKFFITGRPETPLRNGFRLLGLQAVTKICFLHEVDTSTVDNDIDHFLRTSLSRAVKRRSDVDLPSPWPSNEDIRALMIKSERLFIFAATAVSFITSSPVHQPNKRLMLLLNSPHSTAFEGRFAVDSLYSTIFAHGYTMIHDEDEFSTLRSIIGFVVLAMDPLSVQSIGGLLSLATHDITSLLRPLHAVLKIPNESKLPIQYYHKSFPDFVTNASRCHDTRFFINPPVHHSNLVLHCLELMNTHLRKNICSLPRYAMNNDMSLDQRHELIGGTLEYACRFWADHLIVTPATQITCPKLWSLLEVFLKQKQLLWFEVMSLLEDLGHAIASLDRLDKWLKTILDTESDMKNVGSSLVDWVDEGKWFILEFRKCVEASACHIYHSALPLSPTNSLLRELHVDDLEGEVNVLHGLEEDWNTSSGIIITFPGRVPLMKLSHDGSILAVAGHGRGNLRIYIFSATTGKCCQTFCPPRATFIDVIDFSPDDSLLVTTGHGEHEVHLWDMQTGSLVRSLSATGSLYLQTSSIKFSPSGKKIARLDAYALLIWDTETGNLDYSFLSTEPQGSPGDVSRHRPIITGLHWLGDNPEKLLFQVRNYRSPHLGMDFGIWEPPCLLDLKGPFLDIHGAISVAVSAGCSLIAILTMDKTTLRIYSAKTLTLLTSISRSYCGSQGRTGLDFSPVTATGRVFLRWHGLILDVSNVNEIKEVSLLVNPFDYVELSSSAQIAAVAFGSTIRLWSFGKGNLDKDSSFRFSDTSEGTLPDLTNGLHISQDGTTAVYVSAAQTLKLLLHGSEVNCEEIQYHFLMTRPQARRNTFLADIAISPDRSRSKYYNLVPQDPLPNLREVLGGLLHETCREKHNLSIHYLNDTTAVLLYAQYTDQHGIEIPPQWTRVMLLEHRIHNLLVHHYDYDQLRTGDRRTDLGYWLSNSEEIPLSFRIAMRSIRVKYSDSWIEPESDSILRIHKRQGSCSGHWKASMTNGLFVFEPVRSPSPHNSRGALAAHLEKLKTWPVDSSGTGWIYNSDGQAILWIHPRAEGFRFLHGRWRWRGRQLIIAGDHAVIGQPFIFDFADVDVTIPGPADTYRELGFTTVTLSGLIPPDTIDHTDCKAADQSGSQSNENVAGGSSNKKDDRLSRGEGGGFVVEGGGSRILK